MTVPTLADSSRWLGDGTALLLGQIDATDLRAPSLLPGWNAGHVVAHVARNADALGRLLQWAETGIETPMYASADARGAEIERDVHRADDVQRADARTTAAAFARAVAALPPASWQTEVRSARGRLIRADEVPWMRVKEVWLHAVDLGAPLTVLPTDLVGALLTDVAAAFDAKSAAPGLRLIAPGRQWVVGAGDQDVRGPAAELLGWMVGRATGAALASERPLPPLPPWL